MLDLVRKWPFFTQAYPMVKSMMNGVKVERGDAQVVVGARSAIFAPLKNLGVMIIDEEHEATYKQDSNPRYHAREVAILRSQYNKQPWYLVQQLLVWKVVLGLEKAFINIYV